MIYKRTFLEVVSGVLAKSFRSTRFLNVCGIDSLNRIAFCRFTGRRYVRGIGCNCGKCVKRDAWLLRMREK